MNGSTLSYWGLAITSGTGAGLIETIDWMNLPFGAGIMIAFALLLRFVLINGDKKLDKIIDVLDGMDDRLKDLERNSNSNSSS